MIFKSWLFFNSLLEYDEFNPEDLISGSFDDDDDDLKFLQKPQKIIECNNLLLRTFKSFRIRIKNFRKIQRQILSSWIINK